MPSSVQLHAQLLHRKRVGATEGLTKEQKRLHLAGKMLHEFCTSASAAGGAAGGGGGGSGSITAGAAFTGSNLIRCGRWGEALAAVGWLAGWLGAGGSANPWVPASMRPRTCTLVRCASRPAAC